MPQAHAGRPLQVPPPYPRTDPVEPASLASPHTQPLPTLSRGAAAALPEPSRQMQAPQIKVSPPTPWPGWNSVGPLPTDDISLIVPDAGNASLSRQSPSGISATKEAPPHLIPGYQRGTLPLPTGDMDVLPVGDPRAQPGWKPYIPPVLVDVTPLALNVETVGGFTDKVIARNAKIPCEHTRVFATGRDLQTVVHVRVAQGDGERFQENTYLGELELSGLRPAPRGEVTLSVTFELDADGTLQVRAVDTISGREARATMKLVAVAQTEAEIEEMIERSRSVSVTGG
jgi:molecular chaperone DnaK